MSLKLAENDLQVFGKYMVEINEQASGRLQLFENSSSELTAKAAEEDTLSTIDRKLAAANKHLVFGIPVYCPTPAYGDTNDVKHFIESYTNQSKPHQCSLCEKIYASKDSIVRHLRSVHSKTKELSEKEKKVLIKIAEDKTAKNKTSARNRIVGTIQ